MIQWAAFIMVLQGVIGKFGALFIMIPDPVVGGIFCVMFGMITAFGEGFSEYISRKSLIYIKPVQLKRTFGTAIR